MLLTASALTAALLVAASSASACSITLKSKKPDAASAKLAGVNFSKKQIDALKTVCTVNRASLSQSELISLEEAAFKKRIAKIKGNK